MVSIRRRRYLGLRSGKSSLPLGLPNSIEKGNYVENVMHVKPVTVHPLPANDTSILKVESKSETFASGSSTSKEELNHYYPDKEVKPRKRHRRKSYQDQEACNMRGVYFKNQKWQAAIKVDKKQIHLGTVGSQEEAARLYDRAAFMCGREPNFELMDEEKQELRHYTWEEFINVTRHAINNKKNQRKIPARRRKNMENQAMSSDLEHEKDPGRSSMSEDDGLVNTTIS